MTKHRVGRVQMPWTNFEPPIRHPDYYVHLEKRKQDKKRDALGHADGEKSKRGRSVDLGSVSASLARCEGHDADSCSQAAALISKKLIGKDTCVCRTTGRSTSDSEKLPLIETTTVSPVDAAAEKKRHRDEFAVEQEQKAVVEGIAANPSLDTETQMAIIMDYRELHEQFKAQGLYKCNYSAYAWESLRYSALFLGFGFFLYIKWWMTSAVFLGLFWVCSPFPRLPRPEHS